MAGVLFGHTESEQRNNVNENETNTVSLLDELNEHERRLYEGLACLANDKGYITTSQRQIAERVGMARKTLIPARDQLVRLGLIVRYEAHYQGKRDNYLLVDVAEAERAACRSKRDRLRAADRAASEAAIPLPLPTGR